MNFFRAKPAVKPVTLPPYHPDTILRDFGNGDAYTIGDALTGTIILGTTGSGKTSGPAKSLAHSFLCNGFGCLILTAKPDERAQWEKWITDCGRQKDLVIVNAEGDARFNFLDWEASKDTGAYTINVVHLLDEIAEAVAGSSKGEGGGNSKFWELALHNLNSYLVDLPLLAGLQVSLPLLRDIASSAAHSIEQVNDPDWQQQSLCAQILKEADKMTKDGDPQARADFLECSTYWTKDFPSLAEETRSSIMLNFAVLIRPLVTRPLRKIFSSDTTITPEATFDGKIILVALSVAEYKLAGRICNLIWKHCLQSAVLRRAQPADRRTFLRPVVLYADECQNFIVKGDTEYQAVARSAGGVTCYITQNRETLRRVLKNNDAVDSLLANLATKFFAQNTGESNTWASEILGQHYVNITSTNVGQSQQAQRLLAPQQMPNQSSGLTRTQEKRYFVEPAVFTTLRRGGPKFNYQVDVICYKAGHLFGNGSGERLPYKLLTFNQR